MTARAVAPVVATLLALAPALSAPGAAQEPSVRADAEARGWIGVGLRPTLSCRGGEAGIAERSVEARACDRAVLLASVVVNGPADRAGVRPGDVLLEMDGRSVLSEDGALDLPAYAPGDPVVLTLGRDGERRQVEVVPGQRPERPSVRPVKVLRRDVAVVGDPPRAREPDRADRDRYVVRLAPVAAAPASPEIHLRIRRPDAAPVSPRESVGVAGRPESVTGWPGPDALVTSARQAYDSALAEVRPVLDSLREIQTEQVRQMLAASREARRVTGEERRERVEQIREQVGQLREQQRRAARRAEEVRRTMEERVAETRAAAEIASGSRIVRLAGGEFLALSPELATTFEGVEGGLLVTRVLEGFPADELGLRAGDVVIEAGGEEVASAADFQRALYRLAGEGSLEVTWVRQGSRMSGVLRR